MNVIKNALQHFPGSVASYRSVRNALQRVIRRRQIWQQFQSLSRTKSEPRFKLEWSQRNLRLADNTPHTSFNRHYTYHPAWAARIVEQTRPSVHIDIGSTVAFCSLLSAFMPVRFYDYRPAHLHLSNLESGYADLTSLEFGDNSIQSLSCMHVVEHIGLGRYGDPLDYDGDLKAMAELSRVVAPGGNLLLVVPVGQARICFNAHRIYRYRQIVDAFPNLALRQFALVPDNATVGELIWDASEGLSDQQKYGCGCFWFQKHQTLRAAG